MLNIYLMCQKTLTKLVNVNEEYNNEGLHKLQ